MLEFVVLKDLSIMLAFEVERFPDEIIEYISRMLQNEKNELN